MKGVPLRDPQEARQAMFEQSAFLPVLRNRQAEAYASFNSKLPLELAKRIKDETQETSSLLCSLDLCQCGLGVTLGTGKQR